MIRAEDADWILEQLELLAAKLDVTVRYEYLGGADDEMPLRSGTCRVRGNPVIFIDRYKSPLERCRLLATELRRFDLSKIFVTPAIRDLLEG